LNIFSFPELLISHVIDFYQKFEPHQVTLSGIN